MVVDDTETPRDMLVRYWRGRALAAEAEARDQKGHSRLWEKRAKKNRKELGRMEHEGKLNISINLNDGDVTEIRESDDGVLARTWRGNIITNGKRLTIFGWIDGKDDNE